MEEFERYALYYAPEPGMFADFGADWLGWDAANGTARAHPSLAGLDIAHLTQTPRKYGFHGTLKPPFRLATGTKRADLHAALPDFAARHAPVTLDGLALQQLGGFLALTPIGTPAQQGLLADLAADLVRDFDVFRAPPSPQELERRKAAPLTPRQNALLAQWGYPYVLEQFRFHLTLTGNLGAEQAQSVADRLAPLIEPLLPKPFVIRTICLFGQGQDGMFRILHRYALSG